MTEKEKIRNIIELFIAWNGETECIDVANLDSAVEFIDSSFQEEPISENFEEALAQEWKGYNDRGAATVDALEDNTQELAFAKGFYKGWHYRKEEPVSEELCDAANDYGLNIRKGYPRVMDETDRYIYNAFKAGAEWQKVKDMQKFLHSETATFTRDEFDAEIEKDRQEQKQRMMANAINVTVHIDAGNYPYIPQIELYDYDKDVPLAKEGDRYKVILIKED